MSKEEVKEGQEQEKDLQKELETVRDQMLRLQADFENAKKRWLRTQAEFQEMANRDLLRDLVEILDDFERALSAGSKEADNFRTGVEMIAKRLEEFLRSYGVVPMEAKGKIFDPERHEAVAHEATEAVPESTILEELRKGYLMNGRVLRYAVVKVAVKPGNKEVLDHGTSNRD